MRVFGTFLMLLAFLLYLDFQLKTWIGGRVLHPVIIGSIFFMGALITYYDYRYNVIPAMKDTKVCPYCGEDLWIDEESDDYYCQSCDRTL